MLVRTGSIDVELDAAPYADVFLTYALLSDQAYKDGVYVASPSRTKPIAIRPAMPPAWTLPLWRARS